MSPGLCIVFFLVCGACVPQEEDGNFLDVQKTTIGCATAITSLATRGVIAASGVQCFSYVWGGRGDYSSCSVKGTSGKAINSFFAI